MDGRLTIDTSSVPVVGAAERQATFQKAVSHFDAVVGGHSPADSIVRNAMMDMWRAHLEIKINDGHYPDHPAPYDGIADDPGPAYGSDY